MSFSLTYFHKHVGFALSVEVIMRTIGLMAMFLLLAVFLSAEVSYSDSLHRKAVAGDSDAQFNLGVCYENGFGVERNLKKAIQWYEAAAGLFNARAAMNLGILFHYGLGEPVSRTKSNEWLVKAIAKRYFDIEDDWFDVLDYGVDAISDRKVMQGGYPGGDMGPFRYPIPSWY